MRDRSPVDPRILLASLWTARMLVGFLGDVLRFMEPGMLENLMTGGGDLEIDESLLLVAALVMTLPILMVPLSLVLSRRVARPVHIGLAAFLFVFDLTGLPTYGAAYSVVLIVIGMCLNVAVAGVAWSWREVPQPEVPESEPALHRS